MNEESLENLKTGISMMKTVCLIEIIELFKEKGVREIHIGDYNDRKEMNIRTIELRPKGTNDRTDDTIYVIDNSDNHEYFWFKELSLDNIILIYEWLLKNKETIKFV